LPHKSPFLIFLAGHWSAGLALYRSRNPCAPAHALSSGEDSGEPPLRVRQISDIEQINDQEIAGLSAFDDSANDVRDVDLLIERLS
jgi:hypothetical protein